MKKFELIKPGILFGNLISLSGGFFLASHRHVSIFLFLRTILGIICIISSACIFNNIIDRDLDKIMDRTKYRLLCTTRSNKLLKILFFLSSFLLILGFFVIYVYVNPLCAFLSFLGFFFYVVVYSFFLKRISCYSTMVGTISGALPPIIGYIAVSNKFDLCCLILFLMFFFWQIIHAYSILLYRLNDYRKINIPTVPILYGVVYTQKFISMCIFFLFLCNYLFFYFYYVSIYYFFVTSLFIFFWFIFSNIGHINIYSLNKWSRIMFLYSIFFVFLVSFLMSLNY